MKIETYRINEFFGGVVILSTDETPKIGQYANVIKINMVRFSDEPTKMTIGKVNPSTFKTPIGPEGPVMENPGLVHVTIQPFKTDEKARKRIRIKYQRLEAAYWKNQPS